MGAVFLEVGTCWDGDNWYGDAADADDDDDSVVVVTSPMYKSSISGWVNTTTAQTQHSHVTTVFFCLRQRASEALNAAAKINNTEMCSECY